MLLLGIETSCDETGVALYDRQAGRLLAHAVHSQVAMHEAYGGVVPELASRDHIRRLVPLTRRVLAEAHKTPADLAGVGYTEGPGLAGALLVGASFAHALAYSLGIPAIGISVGRTRRQAGSFRSAGDLHGVKRPRAACPHGSNTGRFRARSQASARSAGTNRFASGPPARTASMTKRPAR